MYGKSIVTHEAYTGQSRVHDLAIVHINFEAYGPQETDLQRKTDHS